MRDADPTRDHCSLTEYGIHKRTVDRLFSDIMEWLMTKDGPSNKAFHATVIEGPHGRTTLELAFVLLEPVAEVSDEKQDINECRIYIFDDRINITFIGENSGESCGIHFKYSTKWTDADHNLVLTASRFMSERLDQIFDADPRRFTGNDVEVETLKRFIAITDATTRGELLG